MPPLPRFQAGAIEDLFQQLRFAPTAAVLRDLERAERFALTVDPMDMYRLSDVVKAVTGYTPDAGGSDLVPGDVLRRDLTVLVERLSDAAGMTEAQAEGGVSVEELCERWGVSRKTIDRLRRKGLPSRRVKRPDGKHRLAFMPDVVDAFERSQGAPIRAATRFSRIEPAVEARMLARARRYAALGCSLNQAAQRIAARYGRAVETVRKLLKRHDGDDLFGQPPDLTPSKRELAYRGWRRFLEPGAIGARIRRPRAATLRVINDHRGAVLRRIAGELRLEGKTDSEVLEEPGAAIGLGAPGGGTLGAFVESAREASPPERETESLRADAARALRARAIDAILRLPASGVNAPDVDRIETDIRWALRLTAELTRSQLGLVLRSVESRFGRPVDQFPTREAEDLLRTGIAAAAEAAWIFVPGGGRRLAARAGALVDRALAGAAPSHATTAHGRATARFDKDHPVPDWTRSLRGFQHLVEPDPRLRTGAGLLALQDEAGGTLLAERFGYLLSGPTAIIGGERPRTLAECAEARAQRVLHLARSERRAARAAIWLARASTIGS